jgi:hypothetical protein
MRKSSVICGIDMRYLLITFTLLSSIQVWAQKDTTTNRVITVGGEYKPKFIEVQKIESVPVIEKPMLKPIVFNYDIKAVKVVTDKIVNPIPVADLNQYQQNIYPTSFIKLGYGNIRTPLAEIYLNNKQNKKYSYGMHYRFLQSNSDLNESYADFTNHTFKAYASTFTEAGELGMDMNYRQFNYNFYGFDTSTEASKHNLKRSMKSFDARAYFNSTSTSSKKVKHRTQFNFYNFRIDNSEENQYALTSKIYGNIKKLGELKNSTLSAQIGFDYNTFSNDTGSVIKRFFINFDPRFDFVYEGMKLTAGFNTSIFFNGTDSAIPFVNLVLKASYPIVENVAELYGGIDGRYQKQSLRNIIQTNPYTTQYELYNLYENIRSFIGVNAKIGSKADASFEINYSDNSNMPLYISRGDSLNSFAIKYRQVNILKFSAAFNYSFSETVRIGFLGNFYDYGVEGEPEAWQMPGIDGKLNMKFNIKNKVYPHLDIMAMSLQKTRTGLNESTYKTGNLDAFYDISAGVDYRFKEKLSAFIQANNILGTRYQRWNNYPVYGFNIIGGITMIF